MLKSNTTAHTEMVKDNAEKIRWRVDKLVNEHGIFGITEEKKLFANHPEKAYTTLFYDGKNGGERSLTLMIIIIQIMNNHQCNDNRCCTENNYKSRADQWHQRDCHD